MQPWRDGLVPDGQINCSDDDLVLGMYPLRLVTEAAREIGAQFYLTTDVGPHWQDIPIILVQEPNRTMLPFHRFDPADTAMSGTITCCYNLPMSDQPTLSSWLIEQDGSVRIKQAAIPAPPLGKHTLPERVEARLDASLERGTANMAPWCFPSGWTCRVKVMIPILSASAMG